jgi:hypothetical protein
VADETQEALAYLDESALLQPEKFASTMKRGYVEETVDEWVRNATDKHENLLNQYNGLVYRCLLAEQKVEELGTDLAASEEKNLELQNQIDELRNAPAPTYEETPVYEEAVVEEPVVEETVSYDLPVFEEPVVEEPVYEAPVAPVSEVVVASQKAQRILEAAASEATEHVTRSLERVAAIEAEATEEAETLVSNAKNEAETLVTDAHNEADGIVTGANSEAEAIKANAVADAADALERLETARNTTRELFERVTSFHQFELERAQEVFGLTLNEEDEEAPVVEVVSPEGTEETDNYNVAPAAEVAVEDVYGYEAPATDDYTADEATNLYTYAESSDENVNEETEETEAKFAGENEEVSDENVTEPSFVNNDDDEEENSEITVEPIQIEEYENTDDDNENNRY